MSTVFARALERAALDLLVLGALADRLRVAERGEVVRLHLDRPAEDGVRTFARADLDEAGDAHRFLAKVAIARLSGERGAPLRVDGESLGLPLAQVALAYGADELVAPLTRLSLEVFGADDASAKEKAVLRERELCALIRSAGRVPRVIERRGGVTEEREPDTETKARKRFRAPGREVADLAERAGLSAGAGVVGDETTAGETP